MKPKLEKLTIGLTGLVSSVVTTPLLTDGGDSAVINAIVQVIIAIATLAGLLRRRKK